MNILYDEDVRYGLLAGIDKLADAIKTTLGPRGRNIAMYQKANLRGAKYSDRPESGARVLITNDGLTVAKGIVLPDAIEGIGVELLKEASVKACESVGDGTSTATVLAQSLIHALFRNFSAGANPRALIRGVEMAVDVAVEVLGKSARPIASLIEIAELAQTSCGSSELGNMVAEAFFTVGLEGVVNVEESQRLESTIEITEGIVFERGFLSPVMTTNKEQTMAELKEPYILICDQKFTDHRDLLPFLIIAAEDERSCLIIADGVEGDAMSLIFKNKLEGDMDIVCVTAPLYGEGRRWRMEDMAVQTGGVFVTRELAMNVREISREMLGTAGYVKVTRNQTVITDGGGDPVLAQNRINEIRNLIAKTDYEFDRERYQERLAKFVSGVAKINVGGQTEAERDDLKIRAEKAAKATRTGLADGVVAGGGIALLNTVPAIRSLAGTLEGDEKTAAMVLADVVKTPAQQIIANAGMNGVAIVEILLEEKADRGYDVVNNRYVDMFEAGIVDPLKLSSTALQSAASLAISLLSTGAAVVGRRDTAFGPYRKE